MSRSDDFGIRLTGDTIDAFLVDTRAKQQFYRFTHPEDIALLQGYIADYKNERHIPDWENWPRLSSRYMRMVASTLQRRRSGIPFASGSAFQASRDCDRLSRRLRLISRITTDLSVLASMGVFGLLGPTGPNVFPALVVTDKGADGVKQEGGIHGYKKGMAIATFGDIKGGADSP